jgi:hypothetical protein
MEAAMKKKIVCIALSGIFLLVAGCKKDETTAPGGGGGGFTSGFPNNSVTINPGNTSSAKLTGGTPPYTITSSPNPAVATASITNDTVRINAVGSGSTSVVISDASPTMGDNPDANTLTINITVPGGATITVNGFVKDYGDQPVVGAAVLIHGKPPVTSGTDGSFSIAGVTTPYDVTFIVSSAHIASTYKGLTRTDPTLHFVGQFFSPQNTATISGSVPVVSGRTTQVLYVSGDMSWYTTAIAGSGTYNLSVSWRGTNTTLNGTIHVLRWVTASGIPTSYDAYGNDALTVSAGGSFQGNNFTAGQLTDPAEMNISGAVTRPSSSYNLSERDLYIGFGNSIAYIAGESGTIGDNLSYTVPSVGGATFGIVAYASFNSRSAFYFKSGIAAGSQSVTIPLAEAPQLSLPVNGGTNVDTTTSFLFTQGGGTGVNFVEMSSTSSDPIFFILTSGNSISVPNLTQQGLGLPSNRTYSWGVTRYFPFSSMDEAASPVFIPRLNGRAGDLGRGFSESFTFTTAP